MAKKMFRSHNKKPVRPKKVSPTMFVMFVGFLTDSNSHKYHKYKLHQVASYHIISYHIIFSMNPNVILSNVCVHQSSCLYRGPPPPTNQWRVQVKVCTVIGSTEQSQSNADYARPLMSEWVVAWGNPNMATSLVKGMANWSMSTF